MHTHPLLCGGSVSHLSSQYVCHMGMECKPRMGAYYHKGVFLPYLALMPFHDSCNGAQAAFPYHQGCSLTALCWNSILPLYVLSSWAFSFPLFGFWSLLCRQGDPLQTTLRQVWVCNPYRGLLLCTPSCQTPPSS
jgi:hypothetical protein